MDGQASGTLTGKVALLTGAARRLGAAMARRLHAGGASVAIHYRGSAAAATALVEELNEARPGSAIALQADLLALEQLSQLVEHTVGRLGRLDILVNNASTFYPTPLAEVTGAQFDDLIGTNLRAPLFLAQAAAGQLRLHEGLILNLVDIHGMRPLKRHPAYSSAKAGLIMLTRSLARELAPHVRVNAIAPGPVLWPEGDLDETLKQNILARTPLGRVGSAEDIARAAWFFAAEAPFVTGQVLAIDGGRSLGGQ
ncbi:MAG: pteridine reductase [Steroidobacteraceae bacterium]|jgi:pteridine reductase